MDKILASFNLTAESTKTRQQALPLLYWQVIDIQWNGKKITILQGEDMGLPSRLLVKYGSKIGKSVSVSSETRYIPE